MKHIYLQTQVSTSPWYETHPVTAPVLNSPRQPCGDTCIYTVLCLGEVSKGICVKDLVYSLVVLVGRGIYDKWSLVGGSCVTQDIILKWMLGSWLLPVSLSAFLATVSQVASSPLCSRHGVLPCYSPKGSQTTISMDWNCEPRWSICLFRLSQSETGI